MFGKPDWFREKKAGWGLTPSTVLGWVYTTSWLAAIVSPFAFLFLALERVPEAFIWLAASLGVMTWDVRGIKKQIQAKIRRKEEENLFYIGDDDAAEVETRNYKLQLRN